MRHYATRVFAISDLVACSASELLVQPLPVLKNSNSRASCLALCQHVNLNRAVWAALLKSGAASFIKTALANRTLARSAEWPEPQDWTPADKGPVLVTTLVVEILTWWLTHAAEFIPERTAEIMDRAFVDALAGP